MKIRNVNNTITRKHLKIDSRNKRRRMKELINNNGTKEQLEMIPICIKLDNWLMKINTKKT